jgi:hypothetical protein
VLDERSAPRADRALRAVDAVQQLADGDDADRAILVVQRRSTSDVASPRSDQQVGVDQEGYGSPGAPTLSRAAATSAANPSSGRGAPAISARKRSAESMRARGGAITATGAPLRVTSTTSPEATRLSTFEKQRAASVAVMRVIGPAYEIHLSG